MPKDVLVFLNCSFSNDELFLVKAYIDLVWFETSSILLLKRETFECDWSKKWVHNLVRFVPFNLEYRGHSMELPAVNTVLVFFLTGKWTDLVEFLKLVKDEPGLAVQANTTGIEDSRAVTEEQLKESPTLEFLPNHVPVENAIMERLMAAGIAQEEVQKRFDIYNDQSC